MASLVPVDHDPWEGTYSTIPVEHDPFSSADAESMTHYAPAPNPQFSEAQKFIHGALDVASQFQKGGMYEVLKNTGVQMPEWMHKIGNFFQDENVNTAIGMAGRGKFEKFNWPVATAYGKTIDMPITVNPGRSAITRALSEAPHGDVRALKAPSGDVYMWPANEAMHVDIANTFDLPFKTRQELQKNSYLFNKRDVDKLGPYKNFDELVSRLHAD